MLAVEIEKRLPDFTLKAAFAVPAGELLALAGPSGSGKTTILECLAGLQRPDAGRIVLEGRPFFAGAAGINLPAARRRVGFVFQAYALFEHLTVWGNVLYGLRGLRGDEKKAGLRRAAGLMTRFGIGHLRERFPAQLSGGERQRVALIRALVRDPAVLLLDEPLAALDRGLREQLRHEIKELPAEWRIPVVLVTHCCCEERLASRVLRPVRSNGAVCWTA
ncbi:MAG: ATP-binding cassette domain-containing protein [Bacillota bacterium]|nr:ATP-binding cassette domain-containing protein [Bacillota bacterium]